jgi:hypothetical protein
MESVEYDPFWRGRPLQYLAEILYGVALVAFSILALIVRTATIAIRNHRADSWPMINGNITTGEVTTIHGRFFDYALGKLGYSYEVNGDYYSGYFIRQYNDEQKAWNFVDAKNDKPVLIRYKPGTPQVSVFREEDQPGGFSSDF